MPLNQFSTKDRILGAAEELFAQKGFAGASLRELTSRADVNIAAVNYHFGSKENLINEVFRRRVDGMSRQRLSMLETALHRPAPVLEEVLAAFVMPALDVARDRNGGGAFVRVIARAYAENNANLRKFLSGQYGHVQRDFANAIQGCLPELARDQLYWRLDFLSGALTYAMADFGMIKRPADVSEQQHLERAGRELIRFAAEGFRADAALPPLPQAAAD